MEKKKAADRAAALKDILQKIPGNDTVAQRQRILAAIKAFGNIITFESIRHLDVYDPRPRIFELRHDEGQKIITTTRVQQTEKGVAQGIGVYMMGGEQ